VIHSDSRAGLSKRSRVKIDMQNVDLNTPMNPPVHAGPTRFLFLFHRRSVDHVVQDS